MSGTDDLAAIAAALRPGMTGRGRHSPLYRWLHEHAADFRHMMSQTRPAWDDVARALTEQLGLANGRGQPLSARRVQRTWYAVERAMKPNDQHLACPYAGASLDAP